MRSWVGYGRPRRDDGWIRSHRSCMGAIEAHKKPLLTRMQHGSAILIHTPDRCSVLRAFSPGAIASTTATCAVPTSWPRVAHGRCHASRGKKKRPSVLMMPAYRTKGPSGCSVALLNLLDPHKQARVLRKKPASGAETFPGMQLACATHRVTHT